MTITESKDLIGLDISNDKPFNERTMNSREIAELTGKNHQHVRRDVEKLNESYEKMALSKVGDTPYINKQNCQTYI